MKVKLNNKGFAISTLIYSIFLLFLLLVASLLALLSYRKTIFDAHKKAIYNEASSIPTVLIPNKTLSYDDRINYNLTNDVIICDGCIISKISIDDYEIDKNEYGSYLRGLTPGKYTFVYKVTKGDIEISKLRIIDIRA